MFHLILFVGSKFFETFPQAGNLIRTFYLKLFLPVYFNFISWKTDTKFRVIYRHSVLNKNFNPCLSDIDYSIVLQNPSRSKLDLIVEALALKYRLKILDIPQIYLEEEWGAIPDIDDPNMNVVRFFWFLRKQSWINVDTPRTRYEILKKQKSNAKITTELFKSSVVSQLFRVSDLKIDLPVNGGADVCFYSPYLELRNASRVFVCGLNEFNFILSILPFERPVVHLNDEWKNKKQMLWKYEYYVSRSHYRVHLRLGEDCRRYKPILRNLEAEYVSLFGDALSGAGEEKDYTD